MGKLWNELPGLYESVAPAALKRKLEEKNPDFQGAWANFGMSPTGSAKVGCWLAGCEPNLCWCAQTSATVVIYI